MADQAGQATQMDRLEEHAFDGVARGEGCPHLAYAPPKFGEPRLTDSPPHTRHITSLTSIYRSINKGGKTQTGRNRIWLGELGSFTNLHFVIASEAWQSSARPFPTLSGLPQSLRYLSMTSNGGNQISHHTNPFVEAVGPRFRGVDDGAVAITSALQHARLITPWQAARNAVTRQ